MDGIELKAGKKFEPDGKMGLFFAIMDAYEKHSSREHPLTDLEMVDVLEAEYGLKIERRSIKRYRDFITEYFDVNLASYKKGHYIPGKTNSGNAKTAEILEECVERFRDSDIEDITCVNIRENGMAFQILPVEMMTLGNKRYVIAYCKSGLLSFDVNEITLDKEEPFTPASPDTLDVLREYINSRGITEKVILNDIPDIYESYPGSFLLRRDAPYKELLKKAGGLFGAKMCRVKRKGEYYYKLSFEATYEEFEDFHDAYREFILETTY